MPVSEGTVTNVTDHQYGSELDGDHAAGATSLTVIWTNDFNADGGQLYFEDASGNVGEIVSYTIPVDADDVPSETQINLGAALANAYASGTKVWVYPKKVERWCWFMEPNGSEPLPARVRHNLRPLLPLGGRTDDTAEQVVIEEEGTDQVVIDVLAQEPTVEAHIKATGLDLDEYVIGDPNQGIHVVQWLDESGVAQARVAEGRDSGSTVRQVAVSVGDASQVAVRLNYGSPSNVQIEVDGDLRTLLNSLGQSDWLLADASNLAAAIPWQTWTPTLTGWSANPANGVYRYQQIGKTVRLMIRQPTDGTSNSTSTSLTLPVTAATITNAVWDAPAAAVDNGTQQTSSARATIASGATSVVFGKDWAGTTWTVSGNKRIVSCSLTYEAA